MSRVVALDNIVEIRDVHFNYPGRALFRGVTLDIERGKVTGIMGTSGCGKTTLLRMIGGQLAPAAGSVRVDGENLRDLDRDGLYRVRRKMGMQFQQGGLFTDL
jgi:phospholipid/cholesterol/gamma-HCH transport system ATP-binding protein